MRAWNMMFVVFANAALCRTNAARMPRRLAAVGGAIKTAQAGARHLPQKCGILRHSKNEKPRLNPFNCNAFNVFAAFAANLRSKVFKGENKTQCSEERFFCGKQYSTELNAANAAPAPVEHFSNPLKSYV